MRIARAPRPLDEQRLDELALRYVGRFATTRAKLRDYLKRKLRERGWEGAAAPDVAALAERLSKLGYIDDAAFASGKSRSLTARGYGVRRLTQALRAAGVGDDDAEAARDYAGAEAVAAVLRFAARRRIGPFAANSPDPREREKAIAAMVRAGHSFALARAVAALPPGAAAVDPEQLGDEAGVNGSKSRFADTNGHDNGG